MGTLKQGLQKNIVGICKEYTYPGLDIPAIFLVFLFWVSIVVLVPYDYQRKPYLESPGTQNT